MKQQVMSAIAASAVVASLLAGCSSAPQTQAPAASEDAGAQEATAEETEDIQYVLYLGTNDADTNEPVFDREESKRRAKEILIKYLGGYTISEAEGGWVDESGKIYEEYSLVIYLSDTTLDDVHAVCDELIKEFNQSAILIQANTTTTEFYSG